MSVQDEIPLGRNSKRPAGYITDWRHYSSSRLMLGRVQQILEEYEEHLPLTARQIYYRMIAAYGYPKGKEFVASLGDLLVNARRAGEIPFASIRDDGIVSSRNGWVDSMEHTLENADAWLRTHDLNHQTDQPYRLEVWCEAAGMLPQLEKVTREYSIPVYSCGGFNSLTATRQIVDDAAGDGRDTLLLHLGDFDPSGVSIYERVVTDVQAFLEEDAPELTFDGVRVALTEEQIAEHNLPMDPITTNDSRSKAWRREGRTEKCELEALAPNVIAGILRAAIVEHLDSDVRGETRKREADEREILESLPSVISMAKTFSPRMRLAADAA